ncbi:hypothetical protein Z945_121 [Sulfitobacter noctilucae]|nr:hypothetical protein Z945_121 [Sulfitobacter noctilucae]
MTPRRPAQTVAQNKMRQKMRVFLTLTALLTLAACDVPFVPLI